MNPKVNAQKYNMQTMVHFLSKEYIVQLYWTIKIRIKIINRKKKLEVKKSIWQKSLLCLFVLHGANMLITNRRPASDNWWNKRVLDSCICFLRGEKTHRCYNEISYSLFPILLGPVSCYGIVKFYCDFSKVLVGFSDKIKRTVSNAHLYTGKTLFCPCNVYN